MNEADADTGLLARMAEGDPAAARRLVAAKLPRALGLAHRLLRDHAEAEDVAQEAMLRTWRLAGRWEGGGARLDTWLHTVVLNLCRDRLRRPRRSSGEVIPDRPDPTPDAASTMIAGERDRRVADAVRSLPERQRDAILLVHYNDCSGTQAADILDVSVEALESLLARGRRTLRARLGADEEPTDA